MEELLVVGMATFFLVTAVSIFYIATISKKLKHREEIRVAGIGSLSFLYVSWIVIYLANINPFVKPEFKKSAAPEYYHK